MNAKWGMSQILLGLLIGFQNVVAQKEIDLETRAKEPNPYPCGVLTFTP